MYGSQRTIFSPSTIRVTLTKLRYLLGHLTGLDCASLKMIYITISCFILIFYIIYLFIYLSVWSSEDYLQG